MKKNQTRIEVARIAMALIFDGPWRRGDELPLRCPFSEREKTLLVCGKSLGTQIETHEMTQLRLHVCPGRNKIKHFSTCPVSGRL